ncbi:Uncharacterised protein [Mycobacteroides abscessus subsp. massiliense]|nr:Uncharacterised protein [Mycobacteroides abscessus subsp. massiliense]
MLLGVGELGAQCHQIDRGVIDGRELIGAEVVLEVLPGVLRVFVGIEVGQFFGLFLGQRRLVQLKDRVGGHKLYGIGLGIGVEVAQFLGFLFGQRRVLGVWNVEQRVGCGL